MIEPLGAIASTVSFELLFFKGEVSDYSGWVIITVGALMSQTLHIRFVSNWKVKNG